MGVPPTGGFMGEWPLFFGALETAIEEGSTLRAVTFGLGLVATALTMSYMLWMLKRVFFGKTPEHLEHVKEGSWYMTAPMMVLAGFSIVVGIFNCSWNLSRYFLEDNNSIHEWSVGSIDYGNRSFRITI
jgi:NADH-quinone oxidoreductase subunit M